MADESSPETGRAIEAHAKTMTLLSREIGLCVAGRVRQRHEHLLPTALLLPDVVLDDRVAAGEAVLVAQAVEDALRRVTLLSRLLRIIAQDLIDDPRKGIELRPTHRLAAILRTVSRAKPNRLVASRSLSPST